MTSQAGSQPVALARSAARERRRRVLGPLAGLSHAALLVWTALVVVPIAWTFLASVKTEDEIFGSAWSLPAVPRWDNWARAWEQAHVGRYMLNSVVVVGLGTAGTMLLGSMAAYVLARYRFRGDRAVYLLFVSGLAFPVYLALTPLFFVVRTMGSLPVIGPLIGLDSYGGLVLVYIAYSLPFTVFFLSAFFRTLPGAVAEAAFVDGASHARVFFQIMLPLARPGIVSITIFNVLGQWNQYQIPLVLLSGQSKDKWVLTQGIADISTAAGYDADWAALFAALSMAILPMLVVYTIFQRQIQAGLTAGALK
ncbi:sugar ABC transporter permease [Sphaerisporangium krabiense]|uniref:N-acetylglucosamine transport system permease protein n=1 Tax=Sphaerisporangium krabiense TaxID=763782 RepID=A0A7W8Z9L0_9ACTN|nr:carbohydrate ABC transporter permease [Sphaerisporangium krabiense]MBB5629912.1 N-acetylglucosamine transport system permease protein [Sphaerisporangium krabiense]GII64013.1 sugar ABC transporter permease [Sphaerisporangium krabiense]